MENKTDKLTNQEATKKIHKKKPYTLYGVFKKKVKRFVKTISHNKKDKQAKATEKSSKKKPHKLYDIVNVSQ